MDNVQIHFEEFLQNARDIMDDLKGDLFRWKEDNHNRELIDRIFRYMHSIKSGAAFLQLYELEAKAHSLETLFDNYRKEDGVSSVNSEEVIESVRYMNRLLIQIAKEDFKLERSDQNIEVISNNKVNSKKNDSFTDFQIELLNEASRRGEKFYRIICHINEYPQMLYARAYLLMNNLELAVNVISTYPAMNEKDADFSRFTAFITTDCEEKQIYRAVNVDSVRRVDLIGLDYSSYLETLENVIELNFDDFDELPKGAWLRVEQRRIDELAGYIDQLKISTNKNSLATIKIEDLHRLAIGMEKVLLNVTLIPFNNLFKGFSRFVEELCIKTEKSAELKVIGDDFSVDRSVLDILSETLQHLIRNAIYHGLEKIAVRKDSGKRESGLITINAKKKGEYIFITVSDDGRGIDSNKIIQIAGTQGFLRGNKTPDLLNILSKPGFSTVKNADSLSGRGVGLDLVLHNIQDKLSGEVEMINRPGKGMSYSIKIPATRVLTKLLMIRNGNRTIAIPARNVEESFPFIAASLKEDMNGQLNYHYGEDDLPLYSESGKLKQKKKDFQNGYLLILRYMGIKAALYTDELLMEKDIISEDLRLLEEEEPFLYKTKFSGQEYLYLSPSIIS